MLSRKTFTIGIILIAVLGISACIETNHEVEAPAAVTSANEPADANNQVGATPVADTSSDERSPVWSPDSSKIFFKSDDWICVCNPDGSQKEKLAEIGWRYLGGGYRWKQRKTSDSHPGELGRRILES